MHQTVSPKGEYRASSRWSKCTSESLKIAIWENIMMMMCPGLVSIPNSLGRKRGRVNWREEGKGQEGRSVDTWVKIADSAPFRRNPYPLWMWVNDWSGGHAPHTSGVLEVFQVTHRQKNVRLQTAFLGKVLKLKQFRYKQVKKIFKKEYSIMFSSNIKAKAELLASSKRQHAALPIKPKIMRKKQGWPGWLRKTRNHMLGWIV